LNNYPKDQENCPSVVPFIWRIHESACFLKTINILRFLKHKILAERGGIHICVLLRFLDLKND